MTTLTIRENQDDFDLALKDLEKTKKLCQQLLQTPHYAKLGEVGVFTIVQKAKSMGLNVLDALNGGMYIVNGKVELVSNTMNYLIRAKGHSISKDPKSDKTICILNGKRADNGDTWTCSFSIDDAKKAGIYRNQWEKYPEDMLFARALSRLARQLFPDVIKGCYTEGEITATLATSENVSKESNPLQIEDSPVEIVPEDKPTLDEINALIDLLDMDHSYRDTIVKRLKDLGINNLQDVPKKLYDTILYAAQERINKEKIA